MAESRSSSARLWLASLSLGLPLAGKLQVLSMLLGHCEEGMRSRQFRWHGFRFLRNSSCFGNGRSLLVYRFGLGGSLLPPPASAPCSSASASGVPCSHLPHRLRVPPLRPRGFSAPTSRVGSVFLRFGLGRTPCLASASGGPIPGFGSTSGSHPLLRLVETAPCSSPPRPSRLDPSASAIGLGHSTSASSTRPRPFYSSPASRVGLGLPLAPPTHVKGRDRKQTPG